MFLVKNGGLIVLFNRHYKNKAFGGHNIMNRNKKLFSGKNRPFKMQLFKHMFGTTPQS